MSQFVGAQKDALRNAVEYAMASGVQGDVAEFGCYLGRTTEILAESIWEFEVRYAASEQRHGRQQRRLWAFDSFEGFPEPSHPVDAASPHVKAGLWYAGQPSGGTPEGVHAVCSQYLPPDRISVVKGWYKEVLPRLPARVRFAVVHIDCDFYESTLDVLNRLFGAGMVSDGCTFLFDDWYCNRGSPDYGEQRAWREAHAKWCFRCSDWGPYGVVGRRFIVHGVKA